MTTNKLIAIVFSVLLCLTVIAALWRPRPADPNKIPLVWVSDNNPARSEQISHFNLEHPESLLVLDYGNMDLQKLILQCSSGVGPDVMDFGDDQLEALVQTGVLWDVTEEAKKRGFSASKDSWPTAERSMTLDGRQYGYPCNTGAPILIYNKNVFDQFGIPYPKGLLTMDEFLALAAKLDTYASGETQPGSVGIHALTGLNYRILFELQRGEFFSADGLPRLADSPELKRAFQLHKDLIFKYRIMPTTVEAKAMSGQGGWGSGNLNQFASGRFAMIVSGDWALNAFGRKYQQEIKALTEAGIKPEDIKDPTKRPLRLGAVLIPRFADLPPSYRVTCRLNGINVHSPHREQALEFQQYLAGPTYSRQINESADYLPGNPKYADDGVEPGPPDLARVEMHEMTKEAVNCGYTMRRSPFILTTDITRALDEQISRLESDPNLAVDDLLADAQQQVDVLLKRNLNRDPRMRELYEQRFGSKK
ncbi:hypothetical protein BH09VER1_BH09VER1_31270 [soil metagenome]